MNHKIKILFLNTQLSSGGASLLAKSIFELGINEFECKFIYGYDNKGLKEPNVDRQRYLNLSSMFSFMTNKLAHKIFGVDVFTPRRRKIEQLIATTDIVHMHNCHSHFLNFSNLLELLIKYNKKIIWTTHDSWILTGRCALPLNCENWRNGCNPCLYLDHYPGSLLDTARLNFKRKKQLFTSISHERLVIVSPSEWLAENIKMSYLNRFLVKVIPNGIDLNKFKFRRKEITDTITVLFISNYVNDKVKGPEMFYKIVRECPGINFVTIGRGANYNAPNLEHRGYLNAPEKIADEYHLATFMLFLSVFDNYSTVLLESMACGTPVISFKGKSNHEIIGDSGFIFEDNDVNSIIGFLNGIEMPEIFQLIHNKSKKGREIIESRNSMEKMINEYFSLFKTI